MKIVCCRIGNLFWARDWFRMCRGEPNRRRCAVESRFRGAPCRCVFFVVAPPAPHAAGEVVVVIKGIGGKKARTECGLWSRVVDDEWCRPSRRSPLRGGRVRVGVASAG